MSAEDRIREYYGALQRGEPLAPFFAEDPETTKFGIGERLFGYDEVAEALREQTRSTEDWTIESNRLRVVERERHAWFSDEVRMAWGEDGDRREFDSRWSGTLERQDGKWQFVGMHVSAEP